MKGKLTALFMAACLVATSMAACGNSEGGNAPAASDEGAAGESSAAADSGAATDAGDDADADADADADEDMAEISMTYLSMGPIPSDLQDVYKRQFQSTWGSGRTRR